MLREEELMEMIMDEIVELRYEIEYLKEKIANLDTPVVQYYCDEFANSTDDEF
jgi:hypothetical protein